MFRMCGRMPKQRYLLIILLLSLSLSLKAGLQLEASGYSVLSDGKPVWMMVRDVDFRKKLGSEWILDISSQQHASDKPLDQFPQKKHLQNSFRARYHRKGFFAEGTYRNTFYGSSEKLNLYPSWDMSSWAYERRHQHQGHLELGGNLSKLSMKAYLSGKLLLATPTEYILNPISYELNAVEHDLESYEDIYSGLRLAYEFMPQLRLSAVADIKQANFDASDIYSCNSMGLAAESELKVMNSGRLSGTALWQNRDGDGFDPESRNLFTGQLRYQHKLGTQVNGYLSFISNTCSDSELQDFYLISNLLRTQVVYTAAYDPAQESYLLVGAKYSPEHHANAYFAETRLKLISRFYALAGLKVQPDLPNLLQGRCTWFWGAASELFIHYQNILPELGQKDKHYLGLGTKINF